MTPEVEKKRREMFEAWFDKEVLPTISYGSPDILKRPMWRPFNAALDAVEIELPSLGICAITNELIGYQRGLSDAKKAIESTGLGLKIKE